MQKTEQLNKLFKKWEAEIPAYKNLFVKDGIINEGIWHSTKPKILFIAKEPMYYFSLDIWSVDDYNNDSIDRQRFDWGSRYLFN